MIVKSLSPSAYVSYDFCEQKYFISYVLGFREPTGLKACLGTIVHKVMELLSRGKYLNSKLVDDKELGQVDVSISIPDITQMCFNHFKNKETHLEFTKSNYRDCLNWVNYALEYNYGQYDPRKNSIFKIESSFEIPIKEDWASYEFKIGDELISGNFVLRGVIDLVIEHADDFLEVVDWKTGQRKDWATGEVKDYDKLKEDPQLLTYYYALKQTLHHDIITTIFYINDGGPTTLYFDDNDYKKAEQLLKSRFLEIKKNQFPRLLSQNQSHWKCKKLCLFGKNGFCEKVQQSINISGMDQTVIDLRKK